MDWGVGGGGGVGHMFALFLFPADSIRPVDRIKSALEILTEILCLQNKRAFSFWYIRSLYIVLDIVIHSDVCVSMTISYL